MTTAAFADSSAIVKLYADESGSDVIRSLPLLIVSQLTRVEVAAALWRKHRMGELSANDTAALVGDFEADYFGVEDEPPRFVVVAAHAVIFDDAARMVGVHGLRAYDSVQLASACAVRDAADGPMWFVAFDEQLCRAAAAEAFEVLPDDSDSR